MEKKLYYALRKKAGVTYIIFFEPIIERLCLNADPEHLYIRSDWSLVPHLLAKYFWPSKFDPYQFHIEVRYARINSKKIHDAMKDVAAQLDQIAVPIRMEHISRRTMFAMLDVSGRFGCIDDRLPDIIYYMEEDTKVSF